jgi:uncharacterized protein (TIGR02757 family)
MKDFLEQLQARYHGARYLGSDPLEFVHHYTDPWDQEVTAFLAALLAYGNVKQIRRSVALALERIHSVASGPADYVRGLQDPTRSRSLARAMQGFVHRFNVGADLVLLFRLIARSWATHGSVGAHFLSHLAPEDPHIERALDRLISEWRSWAGRGITETARYLFTAPEDGSCCKRWCMLLRWMGRRDELDPGLWTAASGLARTFPKDRFLSPSQLVIPLDTHTGRISQYLGLTGRKSLNWLAALEVTASLKKYDPEDPTRYDFAISRLGILDLCQKRFRVEICRNCELRPACRFALHHEI